MNILLTGGAGFIGSHVADMLVDEGHTVIIADNLSSGREKNINDKAIFYKMDIRDKQIEKIFEKEKIDCISHHAAQISVRVSTDDPVYDCDVNIAGSLNILQLAVKHNVKKFIFASTGGAIYGEQEYFPADELHPLNPVSPYGIAKLSVEKYLYFYYLTYGLHYTALRYANVYGPRQDPHGEAGVVAIFSKNLLRGEQSVINGDGLQTRDYTFVYDIVKANQAAIRELKITGNGSYNVGTGIEVSVNELYEKLREVTSIPANSRFGPPKKGEQKRSVLSYKKIKDEYAWEPEYSLEEGLKVTVNYFKSLN